MTFAPERPVIVLFDVDGTLVLTGGAGRRAMRRAFAAIQGDSAHLERMDLRGMTDHRILREALAASGAEATSAVVQAILELYLEFLADEVAASTGYAVMPGVMDVIAALESVPGVALGLGTGNVRRGAEIKLAPCGLDRRLTFGGFGCDAVERPALLRAGFERGAARLGVPLEECERVVVGDTPLDVAAADAVGAFSVAVCTGGHSAGELRRSGASVVLEDLTDPAATTAALGRAFAG